MKNTKCILLLFYFGMLSIFIFSCKKSTPPKAADKPTISTSAVTNITANSATCGGVLGDSSTIYRIMGRGIVYSSVETAPSVETFNTMRTYDYHSTAYLWGVYPSSMTGLMPNTTYYVRAYVFYEVRATSTQYVLHGEIRNFKTAP